MVRIRKYIYLIKKYDYFFVACFVFNVDNYICPN